MHKKGKKKIQTMGDDPKIEIVPKLEIIYQDTKYFTRIEPEFRWGQIYQMIKDQAVPEVGLEDIPIYANIMKSIIMKVSTRLELFPCAEVIDWIIPRANITKMILSITDGKGFSVYILTYVSQACKLSTPHIYIGQKSG